MTKHITLEKARYNELNENPEVIKFYHGGNGHFQSDNEAFLVLFWFMHSGFPEPLAGINPQKRIGLHIYRTDQLGPEVPYRKCGNDFLVLANANDPHFALSYRITIDEENESAQVILVDIPTLGRGLIGEIEEEGLVANFE